MPPVCAARWAASRLARLVTERSRRFGGSPGRTWRLARAQRPPRGEVTAASGLCLIGSPRRAGGCLADAGDARDHLAVTGREMHGLLPVRAPAAGAGDAGVRAGRAFGQCSKRRLTVAAWLAQSRRRRAARRRRPRCGCRACVPGRRQTARGQLARHPPAGLPVPQAELAEPADADPGAGLPARQTATARSLGHRARYGHTASQAAGKHGHGLGSTRAQTQDSA